MEIERTMKVLLPIAVCLLVISCSAFLPTTDPLQIISKSESLTLEWDSPNPLHSASVSDVFSYNLYYRPYSTSAWFLLTEVSAEMHPVFEITNDMLNYGLYEFAVSSVSADGTESALHESTDYTANPITGWYVNWIGSH